MEQPFVKDADKSVAQLLKENGNVSVVGFTRYAMGEGLEKKQEDLAAEVEAQINKAKSGN